MASQKLLPRSQIGWEHIPTVPIFLEPWVYRCTGVQVWGCGGVEVTCTKMMYSLSPFLTVCPASFFSSSSFRSRGIRAFSEI